MMTCVSARRAAVLRAPCVAVLWLGLAAMSGCWWALDFSEFDDVLVCTPATQPFLTWSSEADPIPDVLGPDRGLFASAAVALPGHRLLLIGGYDGGADPIRNVFELTRSYDYQSNSPVGWKRFASLPDGNVGAAALVQADGTVLVAGGNVGGTVLISPDGGVVQTSTTAPFGPRRSAVGALGPGGRPYFVGGLNESNGFASAEVAWLDTDGAWKLGSTAKDFPPALTTGRINAGAALFDHQLVVVGGYVRDADAGTYVASTTAEALPPPGSEWHAYASLPQSAMGGNTTALLGPDRRLYAISVEPYPGTSTELLVYDPCSASWRTGPTMSGTGGTAATAVGPDGRIYVLGGADRGVRAYGPRVRTETSGTDDLYLWGGPFVAKSQVTLYAGSFETGAALAKASTDASGKLAPRAFHVHTADLSADVAELWLMDDQSRYPVRVPVPRR